MKTLFINQSTRVDDLVVAEVVRSDVQELKKPVVKDKFLTAKKFKIDEKSNSDPINQIKEQVFLNSSSFSTSFISGTSSITTSSDEEKKAKNLALNHNTNINKSIYKSNLVPLKDNLNKSQADFNIILVFFLLFLTFFTFILITIDNFMRANVIEDKIIALIAEMASESNKYVV
jgi:hypothetical protein